MQILYSNTWSELTVKMLGYHHDHCHHFYSGLTSEIPDKYKYLVSENKKYCFVYKEDSINASIV